MFFGTPKILTGSDAELLPEQEYRYAPIREWPEDYSNNENMQKM